MWSETFQWGLLVLFFPMLALMVTCLYYLERSIDQPRTRTVVPTERQPSASTQPDGVTALARNPQDPAWANDGAELRAQHELSA